MLYWLKHWRLDLFLDWAFFENYIYLPPWAVEWDFSKKFVKYLWSIKYKNTLIEWLDKESICTVNQVEENIKFVLNCKVPYGKRESFWIKEKKSETYKYIKVYTKGMYFPIRHREQTVFYYKHWINEIPNLKEYIKWKDILDCWAFIWDSAMMFSKELWFLREGGCINKIFALEPNPTNLNLLNKTIDKNKMKWKIIPIKLWVWSKKETLYMNDNSSWATITNKKNAKSKIEIDTINNIVEVYWIIPWLIKRDIEWLEYESLLWAKETIKKYKPILLISIYHNGKDFYGIKPMIASWNVWYKFKIKHLSTSLRWETILICY